MNSLIGNNSHIVLNEKTDVNSTEMSVKTQWNQMETNLNYPMPFSDVNVASELLTNEEEVNEQPNSPLIADAELMAKISSYAVPETEAPLEIPEFIQLESETSEGSAKFVTKTNNYLKELVDKKNKEIADYQELVWKTKQYLSEKEMDTPLKIEKWMTDEACWCFK